MTKKEPLLDLLGNVPLFRGLSPKELRSVAAQAKEMSFPAGEVVAKEGDTGGRFYLILEGTVEVAVGERLEATLGPGEYFGEISMIDGEPRSATVTATSGLRTLTIASFNFRPLLKEQPELAVKLLVELCHRLRIANLRDCL